jgi:hypothetical protein
VASRQKRTRGESVLADGTIIAVVDGALAPALPDDLDTAGW